MPVSDTLTMSLRKYQRGKIQSNKLMGCKASMKAKVIETSV